MTRAKRSPLLLLAGAAALTVVAHAAAVAEELQPTRMGLAVRSDMDQRDRKAAQRNRALDLREQAARAAEQRLQADLEGHQDPRNPAASEPAAPGDDQYDSLARIYQAMKPPKAAAVFEQLDLEVQVKVAQKMRDRPAAMILAAMSPQAAARLTMALAQRGIIPAANGAAAEAHMARGPRSGGTATAPASVRPALP